MDKAEQQQVKLKKSTRDSLHNWFAERTRTETETLSAEASAEFNLCEKFHCGALWKLKRIIKAASP